MICTGLTEPMLPSTWSCKERWSRVCTVQSKFSTPVIYTAVLGRCSFLECFFFTHFPPSHSYSLFFVPRPAYLFVEKQNTQNSTKSIKSYARRQARYMQIYLTIVYIMHSSTSKSISIKEFVKCKTCIIFWSTLQFNC